VKSLALLCSVVALALVAPIAASAASANNAPNPAFDAAASELAGRPIFVWCEARWADWLGALGEDGDGILGFYSPSQPDYVFVAPQVCEALWVGKGAGVTMAGTQPLARAVLTLAHEAFHARGIVNEAEAEACAMKTARDLAIKHFGLPTTEQRQKVVQKTVTRTVRANGKKVKIRVQVPTLVSVTVESPVLASFQEALAIEHSFAPPEYQNGVCPV
jgi:hypothetical protein